MFYLIETKNQLEKLKSKFEPTMYLEFIQGNDNTHPILAEIIAIYLNINNTGYIIPINHLECINWNIDEILDLLKDYNFRVLDKKSSLHAAPQLSYTDIQHTIPPLDKHTTQAHIWYYRKFPQTKVNKMIPIGKHLERCNTKYNDLIGYTPGKTNEYVNNILKLAKVYNFDEIDIKPHPRDDSENSIKIKKNLLKHNYKVNILDKNLQFENYCEYLVIMGVASTMLVNALNKCDKILSFGMLKLGQWTHKNPTPKYLVGEYEGFKSGIIWIDEIKNIEKLSKEDLFLYSESLRNKKSKLISDSITFEQMINL